jgi:trehalose 6-phosphate phosphatase
MALPLSKLDPASIGSSRDALFLDFDGTIVDLAEQPDLVQVGAGTLAILARLDALFHGAVAIVTGRTIDTVDAFLTPLRLPIAGIHGLERRNADGIVQSANHELGVIAELRARLQPLLIEWPGLLIENKGSALALHYRSHPECQSKCLAAMEHAVAEFAGVQLLRGKMVIEAIGGTANKASAVNAFLDEPPFRGRRPVYAGDDLTDESALCLVNSLGGVSIKVGANESAARYSAASVTNLITWLEAVAASATVVGVE